MRHRRHLLIILLAVLPFLSCAFSHKAGSLIHRLPHAREGVEEDVREVPGEDLVEGFGEAPAKRDPQEEDGFGDDLGEDPVDAPAFAARLPLLPSPYYGQTANDEWRRTAIATLWQEREKMGHTPLVRVKLPTVWESQIFFKNESASITGSLKHRYAWQLFMWALLENKISKGMTIYEASSGNSAAAEAFYAKRIGCKFTAIVPDTIEQIKVKHIKEYGGNVIKVPIGERLVYAAKIAEQSGGFFMNQFANADKAEEFHESGNYKYESTNVMHEIVMDLQKVGEKPANFFVHAAGTGGTISSAGRYTRKYKLPTEIVLADSQYSVYADYVLSGRFANESGADLWVAPGLAGIGYGTMGAVKQGETTSLSRHVIDQVVKVPDLASVAAMFFLDAHGLGGGTSTGINFLVSLSLAARFPGARVVTLLADPPTYYRKTYLNRGWIKKNFKKQQKPLKVLDCWRWTIKYAVRYAKDPLALGSAACKAENLANF